MNIAHQKHELSPCSAVWTDNSLAGNPLVMPSFAIIFKLMVLSPSIGWWIWL